MMDDPFAFSIHKNTQSDSAPELALPKQAPVHLRADQRERPHSYAHTIDFQRELNPEQYAAVSAPDGPALVLAGAGSGKTRTLTYRVAYLLSKGIQPWEILLITFTNKAAKEMLSRVEDLTGIPQHHFWGGTFHHIGQRFLRMHGQSIGIEKDFTILDQSDAEALLSDAVREVEGAFFRNKDNPKSRVVAEIISYARNTLQDIKVVIEEKYPYFKHLTQLLQAFSSAYEQRKRKQSVADYDDLLELWLKVLQTQPDIAQNFQNRFKHILVDEYQDTNRLQAALVDSLAAEHQIMAVGDDAQCIYTWRGAHFENILHFPDRHPGTQLFKIQTNYRSSPQILELANSVLQQRIGWEAYEKELRAVLPNRQKPYLVQAMDSRAQAQFIVRRIQGLLNEGKSARDIAILYRAHYQAMDLQMELSRAQVPYIITSGVRFFEQAHIKDLICQVRFAWNPQDSIAFIRIASLIPKVGPKTAEKLLELARKEALKQNRSTIQGLTAESVISKLSSEAKDDWVDMALTLQNMEEALRPPIPPTPKGEDLFSARPTQNTFTPKEPHEIVALAIEGWYGDFLKTLHPNWTSRRDDLDNLIPFAQRYADMAEFLGQIVLLNSESTDRSTEDPGDMIRLTTIHQSKGLEYPVVFIIGLAEGLFPIKRAIEEGNIEEERRLFYVAVTRAQEELYLSYPMLSLQGGPPVRLEMSSFLQELPEETYELLHLSPSKATRW